MKRSLEAKLGSLVVAAALLASAAFAEEQDSGFLRDYESLQETRDASGEKVRGWASDRFTPENYNAILLDPLVFYPEPRPSEKVSAETLEQIRAYANNALEHALGQRFNMVDRAGPGVARLRIAIAGVTSKDEGLKPYQFLPLALVATLASRAAEGAPQRAMVIIETEATDSATGKLLGARVRIGHGERLAKIDDKDVITLDTLKPLIDELVAGAFPSLSKHVKTR